MRYDLLRAAVLGLILLVGGCPPENYPNLAPATLADVDRIRNDDTLTAQEQRAQLAALGFSPLTINALLQDKPLANQFGGDLRSAYQKVVAPDFLALTPDEIQIYATKASEVDDALNVDWDDTAALNIRDLFAREDLSSADELAAFLDAFPGSVPTGVTVEELRSVFVDFDPDLLLTELP